MSYTSLAYHIVFSTKQRRPFLEDDFRARLIAYMGGIARDLKGALLAANGMPDHLHLAAAVHPSCAVSTFLREIKGASSEWVHKTFADKSTFGWQDDYSAFTVSRSVLPAVIRYIDNQQEHHREMTFEEELIALFKNHQIEFDRQYLMK